MAEQLRILLVEDSPNDAELVLRELTPGGLDFQSRRVQTESDFRRELDEFQPHLVISDFSMPQFSGRKALAIERWSGGSELKSQSTISAPAISRSATWQ